MRAVLLVLPLTALACATPTGDLTVLVEGEDTITEGIEAGSEPENIADGWTVRFDRYLVAVGDVRLSQTADGLEAVDESVHVFDLRAVGSSGTPLTDFEALDAVRWDSFTYRTPGAADALRDPSAGEADVGEMVENDWTYLIEGTLSNPSGESCPPGGSCRPAPELTFRLGVSAPARFGPCEAEDGLSGVTVTEGGTTVAITLHGDHLFFDRFPSGEESITRRAQWLANTDTDADGAITQPELEAINAAELFTTETHNLAGAPIPIETAWDFVRAQLSTQGHFQGEGECPWSVE